LRTFIYEAALNTFSEHPLTGSGLFTFGLELMNRESSPPVQVHNHAHNAVLHIMAELGLPGLLMLLVTLVVSGWAVRRNWRVATPATRLILIGGVSAVVGFGIHHMLDLPAMMPAVALVGLVAWMIAVAPAEPTVMEARWRTVGHPAGMLIMWVGLVGTGAWSSRIYADYVGALRAAARSQDYRAAADALSPVIEADPLLTLYPYQQGFLYGMAAAAGDNEAIERGLTAYQQVLGVEPENVVVLTNLSALYWQGGQAQAALETLDRALMAAPQSWQIALLRRRYAEAQGDTATVEAMTERIAEISADALLLPEIGLRPDESVELSVPARFSLNLVAGDLAAAQAGWADYSDGDTVRKLALSALLALAENDSETVSGLVAEMVALARTPADKVWVNVVQARMSLAAGATAGARSEVESARASLGGGPLDGDWSMGINYAYAQFLRLMIERQFIPQVGYVKDDPLLLFWIDQLERQLL
jgi:tetratricopeptide (TPR) repeat protein